MEGSPERGDTDLDDAIGDTTGVCVHIIGRCAALDQIGRWGVVMDIARWYEAPWASAQHLYERLLLPVLQSQLR